MWELLRICLPVVMLIGISDALSIYELGDIGERKYIYKEKTLYYLAAVLMAVNVGLRTWYNDTVTYLGHYNAIETARGFFYNFDWSIGANPGFMLLNQAFKFIGFSSQTFLMVFALFTILVCMWFIHKYSNNIWLSVFLFITMGCYTFTMAAIKQTTAVAICLIATDYALNNKWRKYVVCVLIAITIHPYAFLFFMVPLLQFKPWSRKTWFLLAIALVVGMSLQALMSSVIAITSLMGEEYTVDMFSGSGVNIFRLLVIWAPIVLSFVARRIISENENEERSLIMNLTMLNAVIMFIALFGTANYFARLANYFLIFQVIALPNLLKYFNADSKKILISIIIVAYTLYFYYTNVISQPFDAQFDQISIWDYLQIIFG